MAVDERKRHALYERFDEVLGGEHAEVVMDLLPPVGWADVATKQDLDLRIQALESRMEAGFANLRAELHKELRHQLWAILGVLVVALVISEAVSRIG